MWKTSMSVIFAKCYLLKGAYLKKKKRRTKSFPSLLDYIPKNSGLPVTSCPLSLHSEVY
jgi:hypothetical protein